MSVKGRQVHWRSDAFIQWGTLQKTLKVFSTLSIFEARTIKHAAFRLEARQAWALLPPDFTIFATPSLPGMRLRRARPLLHATGLHEVLREFNHQ
ncbi:MAG: hypothetical protein M5R42_16480 [Rhodocyclaceae bacterium]|nr:hypothetical protein [Rhodocyclaceae bacterium]